MLRHSVLRGWPVSCVVGSHGAVWDALTAKVSHIPENLGDTLCTLLYYRRIYDISICFDVLLKSMFKYNIFVHKMLNGLVGSFVAVNTAGHCSFRTSPVPRALSGWISVWSCSTATSEEALGAKWDLLQSLHCGSCFNVFGCLSPLD